MDKDPKSLRVSTYRQLNMQALVKLLDGQDALTNCVNDIKLNVSNNRGDIERIQKEVKDNEEDIKNLKIWDKGIAALSTVGITISTILGANK
jgi:SMC interacting uncharacterized protein involved in chromosome segregation